MVIILQITIQLIMIYKMVKLKLLAFCDDKERPKLICSALNLFEALMDKKINKRASRMNKNIMKWNKK